MFGQDRLLQLFADQFTADGPDFLYRKSGRQAPIRVTAAERQAFIADFAGAFRRLFWIMILVIVGGSVGVVSVEAAFNRGNEPYFTYALLAVTFAIYMAAYNHYWSAPWRALPHGAWPVAR